MVEKDTLSSSYGQGITGKGLSKIKRGQEVVYKENVQYINTSWRSWAAIQETDSNSCESQLKFIAATRIASKIAIGIQEHIAAAIYQRRHKFCQPMKSVVTIYLHQSALEIRM